MFYGIWRKWFWNMAQMVLEYGANGFGIWRIPSNECGRHILYIIINDNIGY